MLAVHVVRCTRALSYHTCTLTVKGGERARVRVLLGTYVSWRKVLANQTSGERAHSLIRKS